MKATVSQIQKWIPDSQQVGDAAFEGVSTDSRTLRQGNLFVALRGESFDAHEFLTEIPERNAVAVVAEHIPEGFPLPALLVKDSRLAIGEMAKHWRSQFSLPLIAVTGSNGKTTVKEMIAAILSAAYGEDHFLATSGNLNNEIGVPQTLFRLNKQHRAAVIELGMNHPGEIAYLAAITQATIALVNNAQREHQEFMLNVQAVAEENGSVIRALPEEGVAVFPEDDAFSDLWRGYAKETGKRRIVTFGLSEKATIFGKYHQDTGRLDIRLPGQDISVKLAIMGQHNACNALAATACCHAIGIESDVIARGLASFLPVNGRMQRKMALNGAQLIDDTYNANPDSVLAAIDVLAQMPSPRILVLGDMGEVGSQGAQFHKEVGEYARKRSVEGFYTLGTLAEHAAKAYGMKARHFEDIKQLAESLQEVAIPAASILVKGSRFMKMERVVDYLTGKNKE